MSNAMGGTVSQYIEKIFFFTFESNKESSFGNIDQLEITDDYFIILDRETKAVLIFNKNGKFHSKIESTKINSQHPQIFNFYFNRGKKTIELNYPNCEFIFDIDGNLISKKKHFNPIKEWRGVKSYLGNGYYAYYAYNPTMPSQLDTIAGEVSIFKDDLPIHKYFPYKYNQKDYGDFDWNRVLMHSDFYPTYESGGTALYYLRSSDYNIYRLTVDSFEAVYKFMFPLQKSLPEQFRTDTSFNGKRDSYITKNKELIIKLGNFWKDNNNLYFRIVKGDYYAPSYIYSISSGKIVCINKIVSDSLSYFLPITDAEIGGVDFSNYGIIHYDGTYHYSTYASLGLFTQMEANKKKHIQYPKELSKYFRNTKNRKGNPILVQIKFKPEL